MKTLTQRIFHSKLWEISLLMTACLSFGNSADAGLLNSLIENGGGDPFKTVMEEWIMPQEVMRLDTAACNQSLSPFLRTQMQETPLSYPLVIKKADTPSADLFRVLTKLPKVKETIFPSEQCFQSILLHPGFEGSSLFAKLQRLDLSNYSLTDRELSMLLNHCPELKKLKLYRNADLTWSFLSSLSPKSLKNLEELEISCCGSLMDKAVRYFLDLCPFLKNLTLDNNKQLTGRALSSPFPETLKNLEKLDLSFCYSLTDEAMGAFLERCPKLKKLSLCSNKKLTKAFLFSLKALENL